MDREQVIKGLECCSDVNGKHCYEGKCPYASMSEPCREQLAQDAIILLKEQEAKKVTWRVGRAHCPSCGELFPKKQDKQYIRFCNYCGQEVKWD